MTNKKLFSITILIIILFGLSSFALAVEEVKKCTYNPEEGGWCLEVKIPGVPAEKPIKSPAEYIRYLFLFGASAAGILAVGVIVWAGFLWMTSPSIASVEEAKGYIWGAILGILLILGSWLILYTINPDLVSLKEPELKIKLAAERLGVSSNEINSKAVLRGKGKCLEPKPEYCNLTQGQMAPEAAERYAKLREEINKRCNELGFNCGFYTTQTIGSADTPSKSLCHHSGNALSGTCADVAIFVSPPGCYLSSDKFPLLSGHCKPGVPLTSWIIDKKTGEKKKFTFTPEQITEEIAEVIKNSKNVCNAYNEISSPFPRTTGPHFHIDF